MRFEEDSVHRGSVQTLLGLQEHRRANGKGERARVYKVDFNRGLVTIMRPVMEAGAHYPAKLELIIMFHGALR